MELVRGKTAAHWVLTASLVTLLVPACHDTSSPKEAKAPRATSVSSAQRDAALASARVWLRADPAHADFSVNPPGNDGFEAGADIDCTFTPKRISGATPKFYCELPSGDVVKVKYGEPNGEIPSELASTRLLSALGFPTDRMYRVHSVRCAGCPLLPQQALECLKDGGPTTVCMQGASKTHTVTFTHVAIERPFPGRKIESVEDQGWSFYELDAIDPARGGSSRAEVDALRLMAVVLAHWDNKGPNQRLVCPEGKDRPDGSCAQPLAMIQDLGASFGPKRMDLQNWRQLPVWTDARACRVSMASLPYHGATFKDQQISESGRQFALALLQKLTPAQLNTLFEAAGVTTFNHVLTEAHQPQAWTDAFLAKVAEIANAGPCPSKGA